MLKKALNQNLILILLITLIFIPLFYNLDFLPLRLWDEARLAINAYEMKNNNHFLITHFKGDFDMWNTKPPLMVWAQMIMMKIIGVNEMAVRLPAAISAFFTCILLYFFLKRYLNDKWLAFICVIVLITTQGFIHIHASRTGDYDAMLTFFTTAYCLLFFTYCETFNIKYLYLFFISLSLAVFTKSIAGLLFLPAIFIYTLLQGQFIPLLKSKNFYLGLSLFIGSIFGYYLLREYYNPGFLEAVYKNEIGGRYFEVIEGHKNVFWYYYNNMSAYQLTAWYLFIPCGLLIGLFIKNEKIKRLSIFSFIMTLTYFLIISNAKTKLEWYNVPLYPFLSIFIGIFIWFIFTILRNDSRIKLFFSFNIIPFIFLFLFFLKPYQDILNKILYPTEYDYEKEFYEVTYFLRDALNGKHNLDGTDFLYDGYGAHNLFYINLLKDQGVNISPKENWRQLDSNDKIIACQNNVKQYLETHYEYEKLYSEGVVQMYKIVKIK